MKKNVYWAIRYENLNLIQTNLSFKNLVSLKQDWHKKFIKTANVLMFNYIYFEKSSFFKQ
jgi:hypothetical protein